MFYRKPFVFSLSRFQLQITAPDLERPLRASWATTAVPRWPKVAYRNPMMFVITGTGKCTVYQN